MLEVYVNLDRVLWQNMIDETDKNKYDVVKINTSDTNFSLSYFYNVINSYSLLGDKRLVFLEFDSEKDETKYIDDNFIDIMNQDYLSKVFLNLRKKPLAKSKLMKCIQSKNAPLHVKKELTFQEFSRIEIKKSEVTISKEGLAELLERVNSDEVRLLNALNLLSLLQREINRQDIIMYVPKLLEEDVFAFSNAIVNRKGTLIYERINEYKRKQMDPLALIGLISSSFRRSFQIKLLVEKRYGNEEIATILNITDKQVYYVSKNTPQSSQHLLRLLNHLKEVEQGIKRGLMDKWLLFELFIIDVLQ